LLSVFVESSFGDSGALVKPAAVFSVLVGDIARFIGIKFV